MYKCTLISCLFSYTNSCFLQIYLNETLTNQTTIVQSGSDKTIKSCSYSPGTFN